MEGDLGWFDVFRGGCKFEWGKFMVWLGALKGETQASLDRRNAEDLVVGSSAQSWRPSKGARA